MFGGCPSPIALEKEVSIRFSQNRPEEVYLAFEEVDNFENRGHARIRQVPDQISYDSVEHNGVWSIGYIGTLSGRERGIGLSAIVAMLDIAFRMKEAKRVQDHIQPDNKFEMNVLESAGFQTEGRLRNRYFCAGKWLDEIPMGIIKDDYDTIWGHSQPHWNYDEIKRIL